MEAVRLRHPKLRLVAVEGTTTGLEPQLASGQLDLALLNLPLASRDLTTHVLFEEDLMLVVPDGHPAADTDRQLTLEDLAEMELLLPLPGTAFRDELDSVTRPLGITLLPVAEIDGLRLIASLTFEGYGPAILPATAVPGFLTNRFRLVPVEGLPRRHVGVAQRSRGLPSAPTRALLELLHQVVALPEGRPDGLHLPD
jgi:DNA-binding transcriptional LysR family regulator